MDAAAPGATLAAGSGIDFQGVTVTYGGVTALDSLTLKVNPGEIVALIGPSGSGKTTALRAVAGFVTPSQGRILIGDRDVTALPPYARDIGMVVQNYALFPHMRVDENVAFGLRARNAPAALIAERVAECLRMVGMDAYIKRLPRELSGGQQQRVAIARALAIRPQVLLLDEPLSALDAQIRRSMLEELAKLHRALPNLTVLYVTHDQTEALTLAHHIGIMRNSRLVAFGAARALYRFPPIASPRSSWAALTCSPLPTCNRSRLRPGANPLRPDPAGRAQPHDLPAGGAALLCIRPHDLTINPVHHLRGTVTAVQWQGEMHNIALDIAGHPMRLTCTPMLDPPAIGDPADSAV